MYTDTENISSLLTDKRWKSRAAALSSVPAAILQII